MNTIDDDEILVEILPTIRTYRSGRIERLQPSDFIPPSLSPLSPVVSKDVQINPSTSLAARLYLPTTPPTVPRKFPVFIFFHGGGFCSGSAFSSVHHSVLTSLSAKASIIAVSVNYRLAPENPLPAAYDDCWEAIQWVAAWTDPWLNQLADLGRMFVAGDSTGAKIAHNMGIRLGQSGSVVEGLVLMHPYFWGRERIWCEREENNCGALKGKDADALWLFACAGASGLDDARVDPTVEGLARLGCRRVMVCVAGRDLLRGRGRLYVEKLEKSGWEGEVEFWEAEGEDHVFFLYDSGGVKAVEFMERLVRFVNKS